MTVPEPKPPAPPAASAAAAATHQPARKSAWQRALSAGQFLLALAVTVGFLAYMIFAPHGAAPDAAEDRVKPVPLVEVAGPKLIRVQIGTPLATKAAPALVREATISDPVLTVTGRVAASLRPGNGNGTDFWQFDSPDALSAYTDWQKGKADTIFATENLASVRKLASSRVEAQQKVVDRLSQAVATGSEAPKDLDKERNDLLQMQITGRKDTYEAETQLRQAKRTESAAAKQLQQLGLDPELLLSSSNAEDIVLADVPEGRLQRARVGQGCRATFYGVSGAPFTGRVKSMASVLSKERRSLRVLFTINDPDDKLRPGMFAEIGLGTDPRNAVLMPAEGIVHVGRADYALVAAGAGQWRVVEVQVGEALGKDVEILGGVQPGEQVVGSAAILFKPLIVASLEPAPMVPAAASAAAEGRR